jgi:hypothetical protein
MQHPHDNGLGNLNGQLDSAARNIRLLGRTEGSSPKQNDDGRVTADPWTLCKRGWKKKEVGPTRPRGSTAYDRIAAISRWP